MTKEQFEYLLAAITTQNIILERLRLQISGGEGAEDHAQGYAKKVFLGQLQRIKTGEYLS